MRRTPSAAEIQHRLDEIALDLDEARSKYRTGPVRTWWVKELSAEREQLRAQLKRIKDDA